MIKRIAITGATGFIGGHLCQNLSDSGYDVVAIVRDISMPISSHVEKRVLPVAFNSDSNCGIFDQCDVVIHLAGRAHILNDSVSDPLIEFRKVNVELTKILIELAAKAGVKRFIFVSSIGVNGSETKGKPFTEEEPENANDLYATSKLEAEQLVIRLSGKLGIEYVIVRPALVFGPGAPGNFGLLLKLAASRLPLPFGCLVVRRNLMNVWNLSDFLKICIEHKRASEHIFLIADDEDITIKEIFSCLALGMERKIYIFSIPPKLLELAMLVIGRKNAFKKLNSELLVDVSKAKKILDWEPSHSSFDALVRTGKEFIGK